MAASGKSSVFRLVEGFADVGFMAVATACAVLFFMEGQGWLRLSQPMKVLLLTSWCPFFWGKYWLAARARHWSARLVLTCAVVFSAITILCAIVVMVRLVA